MLRKNEEVEWMVGWTELYNSEVRHVFVEDSFLWLATWMDIPKGRYEGVMFYVVLIIAETERSTIQCNIFCDNDVGAHVAIYVFIFLRGMNWISLQGVSSVEWLGSWSRGTQRRSSGQRKEDAIKRTMKWICYIDCEWLLANEFARLATHTAFNFFGWLLCNQGRNCQG